MTNRPVILLSALFFLAGCDSSPPTYDIRDPDPSLKIPAIKTAVQEKDLAHVRQMVKDLDSDDSAVRFFAVEGLRRLSGETFGYQYYEDASERAVAIQKWKKWLADREPATAGSMKDELTTRPADAH